MNIHFSLLKSALTPLVGCVITFAVTSQSHAIAIYEAGAAVQIAVVEITNLTDPGSLDGLFFLGDTRILDNEAQEAGSASASASGSGEPPSLDFVSEVIAAAAAAGSASRGSAQSLHAQASDLVLNNSSLTDTYELTLGFAYILDIEPTVMNAVFEVALADALVSIFLDPLPNPIFSRRLTSETDLGGGPLFEQDIGEFIITLAPSELRIVTAVAVASGAAVAVSEPPVIGLIGFGLVVLVFSRRRKSSASLAV